jgi:hypothetical protein
MNPENTTSPGLSSSDGLSAEMLRAREEKWEREQFAQRIANLVLDELDDREPVSPPAPWTTAAEVAEHFSFALGYVYDNAELFGGVSFGDGPKPRKRFPPLERIEELLTTCPDGRKSEGARSGVVERKPRRRRSGGSGSETPLLPVRGEERRS